MCYHNDYHIWYGQQYIKALPTLASSFPSGFSTANDNFVMTLPTTDSLYRPVETSHLSEYIHMIHINASKRVF